MMTEIADLKAAIKPKRDFICSFNSMTGIRCSKYSKKHFNDRLDFDGVSGLTKLDGDTRGGAAIYLLNL